MYIDILRPTELQEHEALSCRVPFQRNPLLLNFWLGRTIEI